MIFRCFILMVILLGLFSCSRQTHVDPNQDAGKVKTLDVYHSSEPHALLKGVFTYDESGYVFQSSNLSNGNFYELSVEKVNDALLYFNGMDKSIDDTTNLETTYWRDEAIYEEELIHKWLHDIRGGEITFHYKSGVVDSVTYPVVSIPAPLPPYETITYGVTTFGYNYFQGNCIRYCEANYINDALESIDTVILDYYDVDYNSPVPDQLPYHFHFSGFFTSLIVSWNSFVLDPLFFCSLITPSQVQQNRKLVKRRGNLDYQYEFDTDGKVVYVRIDGLPSEHYMEFYLTYYE